ncbi:MAG: DUF6603 domain-containing protein [Deltaproteobacteria bacterium]
MGQNEDYIGDLKFALHSKFSIGKAVFCLLYAFGKNEKKTEHIIKGSWINVDEVFDLVSIAEHFGITIPDFARALKLTEASFEYATESNSVTFAICSSYGDISITSEKIGETRSCTLKLIFKNVNFKLSQLPIIGRLVHGDERFELNSFDFTYNPEKPVSFNLKFKLIIDDFEFVFGDDEPRNLLSENNYKPKNLLAANNDEPKKSNEIKWFDVNKSFKVLHFDKVGVAFDGNNITVYLNAGFSISVLKVDFYGLYLSIPLAPDAKFGFGLNGLAVTFDKPPIAISGGLYHIPDEDIYNGEILLKVSKFTFSALGSFCEQEGEPSFFMYLMLACPLGGPAFFFVNGLALGMGVNRGIKLPDVKAVDTFPFVAAAMGTGKLSPTSTIGSVLGELSVWIYPSKGENFLTGGVKFNSFGLIDSFAILMVEFGNVLRFSLLGISELSLPPKSGGKNVNPIAYARLELKATLDTETGFLEIIAVLSNESYILDKNCKLTGGFALCVWFKGDRNGDFFVSLGGCHHHDFKNDNRYPELDKVGINWKISNNLKLEAGGYFAVTPACMMAGANLALTFESGNLKAWLKASADFLIKWKPFFYSAEVSVSIGASYTLKILWVKKTFTIELGADLSLWGPDFSGKVRIKWFIISFTVSFGSGSRSVSYIKWDEFSDSFLPKKESKPALSSNSEGAAVNAVQIAEGLLKIDKTTQMSWVSAGTLKITTSSVMPCTELIFCSGDASKSITKYQGKLGVIPMGKEDYSSTITVSIAKGGEKLELDCFNVIEEKGSFAPAIWKNQDPKETPDINDTTPIKAPMGVSITVKEPEITHILPAEGSYKMKQLLENEPIIKSFCWSNEKLPEAADYSEYKFNSIMDKIRETIKDNQERSDVIKNLSGEFLLNTSLNINDIGLNPQNYFLAYPILKTTGGQYEIGGEQSE